MSLRLDPASCESSNSYPLPPWHALRIPLLLGPMRGRSWLPFSGGKLLRLVLGSYEADQTLVMKRMLRPGNIFFDVGAAVGYYTVLAAPLVGSQGRVVSFEPDPKNATYLRNHVRVNRFQNVQVLESAVGNLNGRVRFAGGSGTGTGRVSASGGSSVAVCRLDDLVAEHGMPTHMKIDVEGAEMDVLHGAMTILSQARPTLFLSTHGPKLHQACSELLADVGYNVLPISPDPKYASELLCLSKEAFQFAVSAA